MRHVRTKVVSAVVLAAGRSVRMGRPKALLPVDAHDTFLSRIVGTLGSAGAAPVVVVIAPQTAGALALPGDARIIVNPAPERGQLSSLQCGLAGIPRAAAAVLFTPVDVPLVTVHTVGALLSAWRARGADVVRPERSGQHGHPVLVTRAVADDLLAAGPSLTARDVLRRYASSTVDVAVLDEGAFLDIDTPDDYRRAIACHDVRRGPPGARDGA